jgi:O-antigen ligase/tetratricopeptide (TPR) repeat protein
MTLNKFLKWTALTGIFAVFIIPFIVPSNLFFPFITGKGFLFRAIVEIMTAAWLLLAFRDTASRPRTSYLLWAVTAFMVIIGLADIFGVNPWKSFWSNFERMEGYISLAHLFLYFVVASVMLSTEKLWKWFFEASIWASIGIAIFSVFQLSGALAINQGGVRVDATFGNATYLAIYLVFNIFFALIIVFRDKILWKRISYSIVAALHLVILYHTATRGSILGLLGGLLLSAGLIALFDKEEKTRRIVAGSIVGAVVLLVLIFIGVKNTSMVQNSPVLSRFASISWADTKTQARAYIWPMALDGWKAKPVLGWGQENFNYVFNKNYDPRMYTQEQWFDHTHNTVLDWLVAGGLLGLLAYLSIYGAAIWLLWKKATALSFTEKSLLTGLGAAYFFHNLFVFDNIVSYILFFSVLAYIHFSSTRLEKPMVSKAEEVSDAETRMAGPVILVALVFCLYFFNYRGYETNVTLIDALRASTAQPVQAQIAVDAFQKSLSYNTLGRPEVMERIIEAVPNMNGTGASIELRQKFAAMAKDAVDTQVANFPGDARYETFAGTFYGYYGQFADAEKHFVTAVNLSPKKQTILFQLGSFYITSKQYDKALQIFKTAYDLETTNMTAAKYYAVALIYNGRDTEAQAFVAQTQAVAPTDDLFIRAYADLGQWNKVVGLLKTRIAADPTDMGSRQNLASAYYQSGNKTAAIQTIRDMIAINPGFKAQGEQYIQAVQAGK